VCLYFAAGPHYPGTFNEPQLLKFLECNGPWGDGGGVSGERCLWVFPYKIFDEIFSFLGSLLLKSVEDCVISAIGWLFFFHGKIVFVKGYYVDGDGKV